MQSRFGQFAAAILAWTGVVTLHFRNDGLWYAGDSSVHAANGAFWLDFLARFPRDPLQTALSYYARYPVINPTGYPPFFYLVEGALYRVFGVTPYVPRAMVLACTLIGSLYLVAWIRRWIGARAGWVGAAFALQPAILVWSNAVMLNLPSMVTAIAALYHARRWLDDPRTRHHYAAAAFGFITVMTYVPAAIVFVLILALVLYKGRLRAVFTPRVLVTAGIVSAAVIPWAIVSLKWAPGHRRVAFLMGGRPFWELASWLYYAEALPHMVGIPVLLTAALAVPFAFRRTRWRSEIRLSLLWFAICYAWFSFISVKEVRYALLLVLPCLLLAAAAIAAIVDYLPLRPRWQRSPAAALPALFLLLHVPAALAAHVPRVDGLRAVASFMKELAPEDFVFYSGDYAGAYIYYTRAADPHFSRGVVRSSKLLYVTRIEPRFGLVEKLKSPADVPSILRNGCGCRYLVVERESAGDVGPERYLRDALQTGDFRRIRSFPVDTPTARNIDIYEFQAAGPRPQTFEFAFPVLGQDVAYRIRPIQE